MTGKFNRLFLIQFIFTFSFSSAQTTWDIAVNPVDGTTWLPGAYTSLQTFDGGFIIAGDIGYGFDDRHFIWAKVDSLGNYLWSYTAGNEHNNIVWSLSENADSSLIMCGTSYPHSDEDYAVIIKTNKSGVVQWKRRLSGNNISTAFSIKQTLDGGYILLGNASTTQAPGFYFDIILVKLNSSGNVVWSKTYGGTSQDVGYSIIQTADSGYAFCGYTESFGVINGSMYVVKTDIAGNVLWSRALTGINFQNGKSIIETYDHSYLITGFEDINALGYFSSGLIKLNTMGDTLWSKSFSSNDSLGIASVSQTSDSGFIFSGCLNTNFYYPMVYLIKTDSTGTPLWHKCVNDNNANISGARTVNQIRDGGYILSCGLRNGLHLIKTDATGNSGCFQPPGMISIFHPAIQKINPLTNVTTDTILSSTFNLPIYLPQDSSVIINCYSLNEIEQINHGNKLAVFPVPAINEIEFNFNSAYSNMDITIYNMLGEKYQPVKYSNAGNDHLQIDISDLPQGIYYVRLVQNSTVFQGKFIKQ